MAREIDMELKPNQTPDLAPTIRQGPAPFAPAGRNDGTALGLIALRKVITNTVPTAIAGIKAGKEEEGVALAEKHAALSVQEILKAEDISGFGSDWTAYAIARARGAQHGQGFVSDYTNSKEFAAEFKTTSTPGGTADKMYASLNAQLAVESQNADPSSLDRKIVELFNEESRRAANGRRGHVETLAAGHIINVRKAAWKDTVGEHLRQAIANDTDGRDLITRLGEKINVLKAEAGQSGLPPWEVQDAIADAIIATAESGTLNASTLRNLSENVFPEIFGLSADDTDTTLAPFFEDSISRARLARAIDNGKTIEEDARLIEARIKRAERFLFESDYVTMIAGLMSTKEWESANQAERNEQQRLFTRRAVGMGVEESKVDAAFASFRAPHANAPPYVMDKVQSGILNRGQHYSDNELKGMGILSQEDRGKVLKWVAARRKLRDGRLHGPMEKGVVEAAAKASGATLLTMEDGTISVTFTDSLDVRQVDVSRSYVSYVLRGLGLLHDERDRGTDPQEDDKWLQHEINEFSRRALSEWREYQQNLKEGDAKGKLDAEAQVRQWKDNTLPPASIIDNSSRSRNSGNGTSFPIN